MRVVSKGRARWKGTGTGRQRYGISSDGGTENRESQAARNAAVKSVKENKNELQPPRELCVLETGAKQIGSSVGHRLSAAPTEHANDNESARQDSESDLSGCDGRGYEWEFPEFAPCRWAPN